MPCRADARQAGLGLLEAEVNVRRAFPAMFLPVLLLLQAPIACKSGTPAAGGSSAAWRSAKPADVIKDGISKNPSESLKKLAAQIEAGLTSDEMQHLAAIDWKHVTAVSLQGDAVWRKGVRVARAALDQNPSSLAALWELLGPSAAYAKGNCGSALQNIVDTVATAVGEGAVALTTYSCLGVAATGGASAPVCVGAGLTAAVILLAQAGCDAAADEPTCTPDQLCAGGCPVAGQQCCGGTALCTATTVCLACPSTGDRCQPVGSTCCGDSMICNASETCVGTGAAAVCQAVGGGPDVTADAADAGGGDDATAGSDSGDQPDAAGDTAKVDDATTGSTEDAGGSAVDGGGPDNVTTEPAPTAECVGFAPGTPCNSSMNSQHACWENTSVLCDYKKGSSGSVWQLSDSCASMGPCVCCPGFGSGCGIKCPGGADDADASGNAPD